MSFLTTLHNINIIAHELLTSTKVNYIWTAGHVAGTPSGKSENGTQTTEERKYMFKKLHVGTN